MGVRLPTILGKAIEDVVKTLNEQVGLLLSKVSLSGSFSDLNVLVTQSDEDKCKDLVACIERMEHLMDDLHKNSGSCSRMSLKACNVFLTLYFLALQAS